MSGNFIIWGSLLFIFGAPFLFVMIMMEKNGTSWNEPLFKAQDYTFDEREKRKQSAIGVAKRMAFFGQLSSAFFIHCCISCALFLFNDIIIATIKHTEIVNYETTFMFLYVGLVCLGIWGFSLFWAAFGFGRLQIICVNLGSELENARKIQESAARANMINTAARVAKVPVFIRFSIGGILTKTANEYLIDNLEQPISRKHAVITMVILALVEVAIFVYTATIAL